MAGAVGDEAFGQVEGAVRVPDVLREDQHRVRGPQVQQLRAARAHLAQADLALARSRTRPPALVRAASRVVPPSSLISKGAAAPPKLTGWAETLS